MIRRSERGKLRMIGRQGPQISQQQRPAAGLLAAAGRFNRYEDRIDLLKYIWVIRLKNPSAVGAVIEIKNAEADRS